LPKRIIFPSKNGINTLNPNCEERIMHEVGMMQNILDAAVKRAKDEGAQHIRLVQMRARYSSINFMWLK
jgi:hypothetical protein